VEYQVPIPAELKVQKFDAVVVTMLGGHGIAEMVAMHCDPEYDRPYEEIARKHNTNRMQVLRNVKRAYNLMNDCGIWPQHWKNPCRKSSSVYPSVKLMNSSNSYATCAN
jgi:hypothetical protein